MEEPLQAYPITTTLFIFISLITSSLAHTNNFPSCLTSNHVNNFTLRGQPSYYSFLYVSIQNLRFTQSGYPTPVAIVLPETKEQLGSAISCCRRHGPFAIRMRAGGHSYEGLSSIDEETPFVIIDMMNLNRVDVDMDSLTAWVEAGATLGETYYAIARCSALHGFSAGSCPTVGIGGHISGGGFGLLSRKYGLAADNVVDAVLVDSNGRFLDRKLMGEDVFWAIRGGGGGVWGAVYAWKIKLLPVPKLVTAFIISRPGAKSQVAKLVHKWQLVAPQLEDEFYLSVFVGANLPETATIGISATFKGLYLGPKTSMLSTLNCVFPELRVLEGECQEMSWIESVVYFSGLEIGSSIDALTDRVLHGKNYFKAKSDYVRDRIPLHGIVSLTNILETEPKGYVILDPYSGMMSRIESNALPFPHRDGNLYGIQYLVCWNEADDGHSSQYIDWLRSFYDHMKPFVSKGPRAAYVNYLDLDLGVLNGSTKHNAVEAARAWGEKYFLQNYDRLVLAKTLIDPKNVFNNPQSIPPLPLMEIAIT